VVSTNTSTFGTAAYIIASGNVGIGTSTPDYKLSVNGSSYTESLIAGSNAFSGVAISGYSNTTSGVYGMTNSGQAGVQGVGLTSYGVYGTANQYPGVAGQSNSSTLGAVYGLSNTGVGIFARSLTGIPFQAGNGTGTGIFFAVYANSNIGIGNSTPANKLTVGGTTFLDGNLVISSTSGLSANGGYGTAGHVLHSNGTAIYWAADDNAGGTVTSVGTGNGLTGGPVTTTGTVSVLANSGITANTTGLFVTPGTGTVVNATGVHVNATYIGTLSANNSSFLNGTAAASYQLNSTLNANIAAYLPTYTGTVNAAIYQTGAPLTGTGGLYANVTTLIVGNNTINTTITSAGLNVNGATVVNSSVVNAAAHTISTTFIANTTGVYHTGTMNAASHTVGTSTIANATGVYTGVVNGSSITVGTSTIANATGVYTGVVNGSSITVGTAFTANATVVNAVSYNSGSTLIANSTGPYGKTEATLNVNSALTSNNSTNLGGTAAASYQLNSTLNANVASYLPTYTGIVNGSSHTVGTSTIANATGVYTGIVNAASHTVGSSFTANSTLTNTVSLVVSTNTSTFGTAAYIIASGNVGIGNTAPGHKLSVNGTTYLGGDVSSAINLTANTTGVYHTGTVNATTISTGSVNVINASGLTTTANVSIGATGELVIAAGAGIHANGSFGTAGQVLTSNATSVYWASASGGGSTLNANNTDTATYYPGLSSASSGSWTNAVVATSKLYFVPSTGTLSATIFNSLSDASLKINVSEFNGEKLLNSINAVSYVWKDTGTKSYGVIAQELEKVLPELVDTAENGLKSVSYIPMIAMLIDVVKKQQQRIEEIEKKLGV
jgi:hypothetical protein